MGYWRHSCHCPNIYVLCVRTMLLLLLLLSSVCNTFCVPVYMQPMGRRRRSASLALSSVCPSLICLEQSYGDTNAGVRCLYRRNVIEPKE